MDSCESAMGMVMAVLGETHRSEVHSPLHFPYTIIASYRLSVYGYSYGDHLR